MSQALKFGKNSWIYTKKKERDNMKQIIKILKETPSACVADFVKEVDSSENSVRLALFYLVAARIINVKQRGEVRIFNLSFNWEQKLKKSLTLSKLKVKAYNT